MRTAYVALGVAALVLSGCSADREEKAVSRPSSTPSASAKVTTPPGPPPPIAYGDATLIIGSEVFGFTEGTVRTDPDGSSHSRGGILRITLTCDDNRVAGTLVASWNSDRWQGAAVQWGRSRITTSTGGWVGRYTGVYTPKTFDLLTGWYTGTGNNSGLSMYLWETTSGGFEATFHALVFPGQRPPS